MPPVEVTPAAKANQEDEGFFTFQKENLDQKASSQQHPKEAAHSEDGKQDSSAVFNDSVGSSVIEPQEMGASIKLPSKEKMEFSESSKVPADQDINDDNRSARSLFKKTAPSALQDHSRIINLGDTTKPADDLIIPSLDLSL